MGVLGPSEPPWVCMSTCSPRGGLGRLGAGYQLGMFKEVRGLWWVRAVRLVTGVRILYGGLGAVRELHVYGG